MDKKTTLAFVLIGIIFFVWLYITTPTEVPNQTSQRPADSSLVEKKPAPKTEPKITAVDSSNVKKDSTAVSAFASSNQKEIIRTIETDLAHIEFSTKGGNIKKIFLKKYGTWYTEDEEKDYTKRNVQLLNKSGVFDLAFISNTGQKVNTSKLDFKLNSNIQKNKISGTETLKIEYSYKLDGNQEIKKIYTVHADKYNVDIDVEFNQPGSFISGKAYDVVLDNGIKFVEKNSADEATFAKAAAYQGGEVAELDASDAGKKVEQNLNGKIDWLSIRNKYFAIILTPKESKELEGAYLQGKRIDLPNSGMVEEYSASFSFLTKDNNFEKKQFSLFVGPVDYDILKSYNNNYGTIIDYGSFFGLKFIIRPIAEYFMLPLFSFLHSIIPNYGLVIILFALIIKIVLYPLTKQSMYSMKKMQLLQPKITEIKEKYGDDKAKVSSETMKLYSTYGINPAGGCLPLILQMPIFISLFGLFQAAIELRQQPFFWWINDLSVPDVIFQLPFSLPLIGSNIAGLAVLMGITTFIQQKQTIKDPAQQSMVYIMPVMLTFMFMNWAAGLNLYYFMFNLFSIAQQYYINHKHSDMVLEPVKNAGNKKKGFMQKLMESAEQSAKLQQQKKKK